MKIALTISGVLAAFALMAPRLVLLSYVLIVPGLILTAAPTVFVYLVATALIRTVLPFESTSGRTSAALGIAALLGCLIMQPLRAQKIAAFRNACQPDIAVDHPIALTGHVVIVSPNKRSRPDDREQCDDLCAAILGFEGVTSVTKVTQNERTAFRLTSANQHPEPGLFPAAPERIFFKTRLRTGDHQQRTATARAIRAHWALRLTGSERLVRTTPVSADQADWVIRIDSEGGLEEFWRIEIVDAQGTDGESPSSKGVVRFRTSYVQRFIPSLIFRFGFHLGGPGGLIRGSGFHVARKHVEFGNKKLCWNLMPSLATALPLPADCLDRASIARIRNEVETVLADENASPASLGLPTQWIRQFQYNAQPDDFPLLERIVEDRRIRRVGEPLKHAFSGKTNLELFRVAFAKRILMDHVTEDDRLWFARQLALMPAGTFAKPDITHLAIWEDPVLRRQAAPFLCRIADGDPREATARLLRYLNDAVQLEHWRQRRAVVAGICDGFIRLGAGGAKAVPRIRELFEQKPRSLIKNSAKESQNWQFALARMGVDIDDLPFPAGMRAESAERSKERIRRRLASYPPGD